MAQHIDAVAIIIRIVFLLVRERRPPRQVGGSAGAPRFGSETLLFALAGSR